MSKDYRLRDEFVTIEGKLYISMYATSIRQEDNRKKVFFLFDTESRQWYHNEGNGIGERIKGVIAGRLSYQCGSERDRKFKPFFITLKDLQDQERARKEKIKKESNEESETSFKWKIKK